LDQSKTRQRQLHFIEPPAAKVVSDVILRNQRSDDATNSSNTSSNATVTEGIGGDGGVVYDVNRLKRNLLQETMKSYKSDLMKLLNSPSAVEKEITEKLAELVLASPVRTTTDSNLLDGRWCLAYQSKHTTAADLKSPESVRPASRRRIQQVKESPASRRRGGKEVLFRCVLRTYCLETLKEDESANVVDESVMLGGFLKRTKTWSVEGLTRKSMLLRPLTRKLSIFGNIAIMKQKLDPQQLTSDDDEDTLVVYSDVDLCILTKNTGNGAPSSFMVFTKNANWLNPTKRLAKCIRFLVATGLRTLLPVKNALLFWRKKKDLSEDGNLMLRQIDNSQSTLRVLKLGDDPFAEDNAWESLDDPFIDLSPDERQAALKEMSVRQIAVAGNKRSKKSKLARLRQRLRGKQTYFKKPKDFTKNL